jgi:hypothetical protein
MIIDADVPEPERVRPLSRRCRRSCLPIGYGKSFDVGMVSMSQTMSLSSRLSSARLAICPSDCRG